MLFNNIKIHIISVFFVILFSMLYALLSVSPAYASTINIPPNFLKLSSGLVGYWTFDGKDVVNGVALDKSGSGNNGNLISIATSTFYAQGKIGQGFKFDGVDDYVNAGSASSIDALGPLTYSAWVYPRSTGNGAAGTVIYKGNKTLGIVSGKWRFSQSCSGQSLRKDSSSSIALNTWTHLLVTWDGGTLASGIKVYINGTLDEGITQDCTGTLLSDAAYNVSLGSKAGANAFDGSLDDVRIYNRALSATEITTLYSQGASTKFNVSPNTSLTSGLVGYWTFDGKDVVNGVALDKSGSGNNGNLISIATSTFYTQGKIGQGFKFDGVNDYVTMGNSSTLNLPTAVTLSVWVKSTFNFNSVSNVLFSAISRMQSNSPFNGYELGIGGNYISAGNKAYFHAGGTYVTGAVIGTTNINDGKWHNLVGKYDGTTSYIYVDGVYQNSAIKTNNLNLVSENLDIGTTYDRVKYFHDSLDDVRIYNRVLTATEITQLYNIGAATKFNALPTNSVANGLVGYWTFDGKDVVNGVALDMSGNGNNGNLISIATSTFYTQGKIGQGFKFDGVNDYVNVGTLGSFGASNGQAQMQQGATISAWVKTTNTTDYMAIIGNELADTSRLSIILNLGQYADHVPGSILINWKQTTTYGKQFLFNANGLINDGKWHLLTVVMKVPGTQQLWIDGVSRSVISVDDTFSIYQTWSITPGLGVGAYITSGGISYPFSGSIDDVRIYNRVLSAGEVGQLYNLGR